MEDVLRVRVESYVSGRVDSWMMDAGARHIYSRLDDRRKSYAKKILSRLAQQRMGDRPELKIIARLLLRCVETTNLNTVLEAISAAHDSDIDTLHGMLTGRKRWSVRQIAQAASLVKYRCQTLDELEECVADYEKNEPDIHSIIEANPWIVHDRFMAFRSNKMIRTTLRELFSIGTTDPAARRKPDLFFILADPGVPEFLFVELKGPDQMLVRDAQSQATRDAKTFLDANRGRAHVILVGTEFATDSHVDGPFNAPDYSFEAITYKDLIRRARSRLAYVNEATSGEEEALITAVYEAGEAELRELVGLSDGDDVMDSDDPQVPLGL